MNSITSTFWQVKANDPLALTRILNLAPFRVQSIEYDDHLERLVLRCERTWDTAYGPRCKSVSEQVHQYHPRLVRDLPWSGYHCSVAYQRRRFWCAVCQQPFTEKRDIIAPFGRITRRSARFLFKQCRMNSMQQVSQREQIG